jgi:hypothetical protein
VISEQSSEVTTRKIFHHENEVLWSSEGEIEFYNIRIVGEAEDVSL